MAEQATEQTREGPLKAGINELPTARLGQEFQNLATAVAERALSNVTKKIDGLAGRLTGYVEDGSSGLIEAVTGKSGSGMLSTLVGGLTGGSGVSGLIGSLTGSDGEGGGHPMRAALATYAKEKIKGIFSRGGGGGGKGKSKKLKLINIVESIDIGAPLRVVYDQWTQFEQFPSFMKKVETVNQKADEKLDWKAHIWWSHRTWESTIIEQTPDKLIIWRSQGPKGYVDGAVTFHEITPDMTRVLLVLEYHPQGMFEHTGNLWRAQGRRARLELKHFRRHVMTQALLRPDEVEGWRGVIHESQVVKDHETAVREEQEAQEPEGREAEGREPEAVERAEEEEPYEYEAEAEEGEAEEPEAEEPEEEAEEEFEEPEAEERERAPSRPVRPRRPMAERPARRRGQERPAREREEAEEAEEPEERPQRRRRIPAESRSASSASLRHGS